RVHLGGSRHAGGVTVERPSIRLALHRRLAFPPSGVGAGRGVGDEQGRDPRERRADAREDNGSSNGCALRRHGNLRGREARLERRARRRTRDARRREGEPLLRTIPAGKARASSPGIDGGRAIGSPRSIRPAQSARRMEMAAICGSPTRGTNARSRDPSVTRRVNDRGTATKRPPPSRKGSKASRTGRPSRSTSKLLAPGSLWKISRKRSSTTYSPGRRGTR